MLKTPNQHYQNCLRVIESIEQGEYYQGQWATCICGHALKVMGEPYSYHYNNEAQVRKGAAFLGIDVGHNPPEMFLTPDGGASKAWAIRHLRQHMATLTD